MKTAYISRSQVLGMALLLIHFVLLEQMTSLPSDLSFIHEQYTYSRPRVHPSRHDRGQEYIRVDAYA